VQSVVGVLNEAIQYALEFRESLTADALDLDLAPLAAVRFSSSGAGGAGGKKGVVR
jgi:hypothetical protein